MVGYSELYECDFDKPLPVPDNSIDIVVFLHVIEHLPRPSFTMGELSRILRPGGLMLGGSPVAPKPVAWARERQLRSRLRRGEVEAGGHINSMDCSRWRILVKNSGLNLDMMTGTFLVRWSGSPLENQAWWLRLNQIWGAFFPSLGGEIYLSARKPSSEGLLSAKDLPARTSMPSMWKRGLAGAFIVFIVFFGIFIFDVKWGQKGPVAAAVMKHQDGNDVFYTVKHPAMNKAIKEKIVIELYHPDDIVQTVDIDRKSGKASQLENSSSFA